MTRPYGVWVKVHGQDWACVGTYALLVRATEVMRERRYCGPRYITDAGVRATTVQSCECDSCDRPARLIEE